MSIVAKCIYLISTKKMNDYANIRKIDEPKWIIKPESSQEVSGCIISKCCVSKHSTQQIKHSWCHNSSGCSLLHLFVFWWSWSQCILHFINKDTLELTLHINGTKMSVSWKWNTTCLNFNEDKTKRICKSYISESRESFPHFFSAWKFLGNWFSC